MSDGTEPDASERNGDQLEAEQDTRFGFTELERAGARERARKAAQAMTLLSFAATGWCLFYPHPYGWAVGATALCPLLAFAVTRRFSGLILLDQKPHEDKQRPTAAAAIWLPSCALAMRGMDFDLLHWSNFWAPWLLASAAVTVMLVFSTPHPRAQKATIAGAAIALLGWAFGVVVHVNCFYDGSIPRLHEATVADAHVVHDKRTAYRLQLRPFVDGIGSKEVRVPRPVYERHPKGSTVEVRVFQGSLHIPWFYVR